MEMNSSEKDDGAGEKRVPRSLTVASSMGRPDGRTEGDAQEIRR